MTKTQGHARIRNVTQLLASLGETRLRGAWNTNNRCRWSFGGWSGGRSAAPSGVDQFYPTAGHNEALARIEYLVESRRRLGALLGESGVGKSLVLRVAAEQLTRKGLRRRRGRCVGATTREVLWHWPAACDRRRARMQM